MVTVSVVLLVGFLCWVIGFYVGSAAKQQPRDDRGRYAKRSGQDDYHF